MKRTLLVWLVVAVAWPATVGAAPSLSRPESEPAAVLEGAVTRVDAAQAKLYVGVDLLRSGDRRQRMQPPQAVALLEGVAGLPLMTLSSTGSRLSLRHLVVGQRVAISVAGPLGDLPFRVLRVVAGTPDLPDPLPTQPAPPSYRWSAKLSRGKVTVPMIFPVLGSVPWHDTFLHRVMGRPHTGQDLVTPKLRPVVACFDGRVVVLAVHPGRRANTVVLVGTNGWEAIYTHLNDDHPGTNDAKGGVRYAFAPGLQTDSRVRMGQLLGYVGDSGQATGPHLHFELRRASDGMVFNAAPSLKMSQKIARPRPAAIGAEPRPGPGQFRLDGYLRSVNPQKQRIYIDVRARVDNHGPLLAVTSPQAAIVRVPEMLEVIGWPGGRAPLSRLVRGQHVSLLLRRTSAGLIADRAIAEWPGLVTGRPMAEAMEKFVGGG